MLTDLDDKKKPTSFFYYNGDSISHKYISDVA